MARALGTMDDDESDTKPKKKRKIGGKNKDPKGSNVIRLRAPGGKGKDGNGAGLSDDLGVDYDLYDESDPEKGGDAGEDAVYLESDEEPIFHDE
jgi:hypothetical protein